MRVEVSISKRFNWLGVKIVILRQRKYKKKNILLAIADDYNSCNYQYHAYHHFLSVSRLVCEQNKIQHLFEIISTVFLPFCPIHSQHLSCAAYCHLHLLTHIRRVSASIDLQGKETKKKKKIRNQKVFWLIVYMKMFFKYLYLFSFFFLISSLFLLKRKNLFFLFCFPIFTTHITH